MTTTSSLFRMLISLSAKSIASDLAPGINVSVTSSFSQVVCYFSGAAPTVAVTYSDNFFFVCAKRLVVPFSESIFFFLL
jgi:hypothetical protein